MDALGVHREIEKEEYKEEQVKRKRGGERKSHQGLMRVERAL